MNAAKNVTASFNPAPFAVVTTGVTAGGIIEVSSGVCPPADTCGGNPIATVSTRISFKTADIGKTGSVFVTALVPASFWHSLVGAQTATKSIQANVTQAAAADSFVLIQLTSSGWQQVTNGQLIPYATGVLGDQLAAITILNNTNTTGLSGSQICVGYGTSVSDMTSAGRMQLIATIPDPTAKNTNTGSCNVTLPISDARVFAYAEANYASLFAGTATSGQTTYQGNSYNYRYYPVSQNYLAVDTSGVISILGPVSGGVVSAVGPVESFRSVITTWEAAQ
jgi:hypothetical protein